MSVKPVVIVRLQFVRNTHTIEFHRRNIESDDRSVKRYDLRKVRRSSSVRLDKVLRDANYVSPLLMGDVSSIFFYFNKAARV